MVCSQDSTKENTGFLQVSTVYKASHAESRFPFPSYKPRYWLNINHGIIWSENTTQSLKGRAKFPLFCLKQFLRYIKTNISCIQSAGVYCVLFYRYMYVLHTHIYVKHGHTSVYTRLFFHSNYYSSSYNEEYVNLVIKIYLCTHYSEINL